jgi:hypothetical protein
MRRRLRWDLERKRELAERVVARHETCKALAEAYGVGYFQMYRLLRRDPEVSELIREALAESPASKWLDDLWALQGDLILRSIDAALGVPPKG